MIIYASLWVSGKYLAVGMLHVLKIIKGYQWKKNWMRQFHLNHLSSSLFLFLSISLCFYLIGRSRGLSLWAKIVLLSQSSDLLRVKLVNILRTCIIKNTRELSIIHFVHERSWNRKLIASTALIWLVYGSKWLLCPPSFWLRATYRCKLVEIHNSSVCQEWGLGCLDLQWMFGIQLCDSIFRRGEFPALPSSSLSEPPV